MNSIRAILIIGILLQLAIGVMSCTSSKFKNSDKNMLVSYLQFIDITIPHIGPNNFLKKEIETTNANGEHPFDNDRYKYENRKYLNPNSNELLNYVILDLMISEQYLIPFESIPNKEILWHWLSVFVGNNNIPDTRNRLSKEIYENPNYKFNIEESSNLFNHTEFSIYSVKLKEEQSIGIAKRINIEKLVDLGAQIGFEIREMK